MVDIATNIDIVKARDLTADPLLAQYATEIHRLGKRVKKDVIAIGHYLDQAQKHAGRGAWHLWVNTEFGWSDQTARRFIHVYELSRDSKFNNLLNSDLPLSALYQLAAPKTPGRARDEVAERVEAGEKVLAPRSPQPLRRRRANRHPKPRLKPSAPARRRTWPKIPPKLMKTRGRRSTVRRWLRWLSSPN